MSILRITRRHAISLLIFSFIPVSSASASESILPIDQPLTGKAAQEEQKARAVADQFQNFLQESGSLTLDTDVETYINEVAKPFFAKIHLATPADFRIKIVRDPTVNAFALASGNIYFHSGILARLKNEDQLAFVLAHEISHVYHRDHTYSLMNFKKKTVAFKIADLILTAPAAFVGASGLTQTFTTMIYGSAVQGYGRENESRADLFALESVTDAGYDTVKAASFFDVLLNEYVRFQKGFEIYFLASHPANINRKREAAAWIHSHRARIESSPKKEVSVDFFEKTYQIRIDNIRLNIFFERYFHALELIDEILSQNSADTEALYLKGEVYRKLPSARDKIKAELATDEWKEIKKKDGDRLNSEWLGISKSAYEAAIAINPSFSPPYKGLGEWYLERGTLDKAKEHFSKYLNISPEAKDKRSVKRHLNDIEKKLLLKSEVKK